MTSTGTTGHPLARRLLPILLLASGFCGISYEILYAKLLGNLLGNRFAISAAVLLTFLAGIGVGTLWAYRFVRRLWAVEAAIGLYAIAVVAAYEGLDALLYARMPAVGVSLAACVAVSVVLLAVPGILVGCSVPLFAAYLSTLRSRHVFAATYAIYNLGAAITALTLEFGLLRVVGLRSATLGLASLNLVIAAALIALVRTTPVIPPPSPDFRRRPPAQLTALAVASVASAIFQLTMIKVAEFVFGPFNETFSLVLATVLLGLAVGSWAAGRLGLTFRGAMLVSLAGLVLLLAGLETQLAAYAAQYDSAVRHPVTRTLLKFAMTVAMMGLPAIGFGATIPALIREHRDIARESGRLLFLSSMANVVGFLLMAFVLHQRLDYGPLLLVVVGLAATALVVHGGPRRAAVPAALLLAAAAVGARFELWDEALLYSGHTNFHDTESLRLARQDRLVDERFKGPQDVFAITRKDGNPYFFINGYVSIPLNTASEKIVGALAAIFAPRTDRALVLGVGSGATAGTVGLIFDRTDAVEINRVVLDNLFRMKSYNFDIESRPSVTIHHDDGIHFLKTRRDRYSLILNTVTTPLYFSSSKLYTRDFFLSVRDRLAPDGVYTTWIDRKIGDRGVEIILETLSDTFDHCWVTYLRSSYYMMVCSPDEIRVRQLEKVVSTATLRRFLAERHQLALEMIPYSVLSTDAGYLRSGRTTPVNTLDFPVLEHEMARLGGRSRLYDLSDRMVERIDLDRLERTLSRDVPWEPGAFVYWADVRLDSDSLLGETLEEIFDEQLGDFDDSFVAAARRAAEHVGTAEGDYLSARALYARGICSAAIPLFERAVALDPEQYRAHYFIGRCYERQGDEAGAMERYREALRVDPTSGSTREALRRLENAADRVDE